MFGLLAVYRIGSHIPTPGVNTAAVEQFAQSAANTMFGLYDMFSGKNLSQMTIFALGVMPYISASIILQLLTVVWPYLERLSKEGELGRRKITQYTRYGTILLSVVQAYGIAIFLERSTGVQGGLPLVYNPGWGFEVMAVLTLTTGSVFVMWLGEQITERGIGNGMSLLIYAGIVVGFPHGILTTLSQLQTGDIGLLTLVLLVALMIAVVGGIVFMERGQRRVTVQYARRMVGRRMYGGASTHIPLKVNTGGVMPVIFSSSILAFPYTISKMGTPGGWLDRMGANLSPGYPLYTLLDVVLIIFFAYFYTAIIFNPDDVAENMRKYGGFVPGIRPGKRTAEHIDQILARITLVGALYLVVVAQLPTFLTNGFKVAGIPFIGERLDAVLPQFITQGMHVQFFFGGTSLLIIVGVAMDTVQQIESQLIMRHYDGFMKKTRVRRTPRLTNDSARTVVRVIMLGAPGAGKGTQAERFAKVRGIPRISTGDILREAVTAGSELGRAARTTMEAGRLVSDEIMIGVVKERLLKKDADQGFVLDGFPRTVAQAEALDQMLDKSAPLVIVDIEVPEDVLVKRLAERRICGNCGWGAAPGVTACARCGGPLIVRSDDGEETVRERLRVYARNTQPLVEFYCRRSTFRSIDGDQTTESVSADLSAAVASVIGGRM